MIDFNAITGEMLTIRDDPHYVHHGGRNPGRTYERQNQHFIGVDGEGESYPDPNGEVYTIKRMVKNLDGEWHEIVETHPVMIHKYVLLSVGDNSLYHDDASPLSSEEIFEFLWENFRAHPNAIFIGFFLEYDRTMWFKDLPYPVARELISQEGIQRRERGNGRSKFVSYHGWKLNLFADRRFDLRKRGEQGTMYINDIGSFFQEAFITVLKKWPGVYTQSEFEKISRGKASRSDAKLNLEMIEYNVLENTILARVGDAMNQSIKQMGIRLYKNQWFSPGQVAQKWLDKIGALTKAELKDCPIPDEVMRMARESYTAGWSETFAHGHVPGRIYQYDRNSAYPYEIGKLPCLRCGTWTKLSRSRTPSGIAIVDVTVKQVKRDRNSRLGSMPCRTKSGAILRPRCVSGIYWWAELMAAKEAGCIDDIKIHKAWQFTKNCNHRPYAAIEELYEDRRTLPDSGSIRGKDTPLGKIYKLAYNSSYGKFSQSVGHPKYSNPICASLITSGCRSEIWKAIATHPKGTMAVVMVATDAVYFTSPHPGLTISDKLGDWSEETKDEVCIWGPGVHWDNEVRKLPTARIRSRGLHGDDLREVIEYLDSAFETHRRYIEKYAPISEIPKYRDYRDYARKHHWPEPEMWAVAMLIPWPKVEVPVKFGIVSAKLALQRGNWLDAGRIADHSRYFNSRPDTKRDIATEYVEDGICWTLPYERGPDGLRSEPYREMFGMDLREELTEQHGIISDDDSLDKEFYEFVNHDPGVGLE